MTELKELSNNKVFEGTLSKYSFKVLFALSYSRPALIIVHILIRLIRVHGECMHLYSLKSSVD